MKKLNYIFVLLLLLAFTQCNEPAAKTHEQTTTHQDTIHAEHVKPFYQGTIMETIDAGGYTYLKIHENLEGHKHVEGHEHNDFWIAVTTTTAQVGDEVRFQKELVTEQFYSKILDRTFDELMFASNLQHKVK